MITSADDSLWHQLPTTFDHVGTSDPRFYDRYWFAAYDPEGEAAVQLTLGAYRNMDVMDAGVVVVHGSRQWNLRASRVLGAEIDPSCGPIRVRVREPLKLVELSVDDGRGIELQLDWAAITAPHEEDPHFERVRRRVVQDYRRFNQIGQVSGTLRVDSTEFPVSNWWGCRDRSWGVRPRMGIREPVTGPKRQLSEQGFAMAFLFFSTEDFAGHLHLRKDHGSKPYIDGSVVHRTSGEVSSVADLAMEFSLYQNTRRVRRVSFVAALESGEELTLAATAMGSSIAMQGLGYSGGFEDGRGLGVWRGEDHVEADVWDVSHPSLVVSDKGVRSEPWHRIQPVEVVIEGDREGGDAGTGSLTAILSGHLPEFGLTKDATK